MEISVIIPAWNAERHISRAIRSVLAQTRPADEIIVVDDGSTDGTAEAVQTFGQAVRLIQQPHAGVSVARNTGIAAARGQWMAFLDADDEWLADKLRLQAAGHEHHTHLKWSFTRLEWAHPQWAAHRVAHPPSQETYRVFEDYLAAYCEGFFISTITVMIHRSVFDAVGGFEPGMKRAQDNDLWFRIAYRFPQVGYVPRSLAVYHLDTPDSSTKINDQVEYMIDLIERHRAVARAHHRSEAFARCAVHMLQIWIRELIRQNRTDEARVLLQRYRRQLPERFCREAVLRLHTPRVVRAMMDLYQKTKNAVRGKR
jgi:glycosyltransferase involved in cell wall biosynthesis